MKTTKLLLCIVFLLCNCILKVQAALQVSNFSAPASINMYEKYEINFAVTGASFNNPYDPAQIDIYADFISPSGKTYRQPAFYFEDAVSTSIASGQPAPFNNFQRLAIIPDSYIWKVRFATTETGQWTFRITVNDKIQQAQIMYPATPYSFNSSGALPDNHGFISLANSKYLKFSDKTPFYPIGNSYPTWNYGIWVNPADINDRPIYDYGTNEVLQVMNEMANQGINFFRMEINFPEGLNLVGKDWGQSEKNYVHYFNQLNAWQLDQIINYARTRDIHLEFAVFPQTMFQDFYATTDNPYSCHWTGVNPFYANVLQPGSWGEWGTPGTHPADSKGQCANVFAFYTDADAIRLTKNMFRYISARWSYSTSLMSYELWDEFDAVAPGHVGDSNHPTNPCSNGGPWPTKPGTFDQDVVNWHITMRDYIKSIDNFKHLITTANAMNSLTTPANIPAIYSAMDFTQSHIYGEYSDPNNNSFIDAKGLVHYPNVQTQLFGDASVHYEKYSKPYMTGEVFYFSAPDHYTTTWMASHDPTLYDMHNIFWSTLFNGSFAAGSVWDNLFMYNINHNYSYLSNYKGIAAFSKLLPQFDENYVPMQDTNYNNSFRMNYLKNLNGDKIYGWVQDKNFTMNNIYKHYGSYLTDFTTPSKRPPLASSNYSISLPITRSGVYSVKWYNTETGALYSYYYAPMMNNQVTIEMPEALRNGKFADAGLIVEYNCASKWNTTVLRQYMPPNVKQYSPLAAKNNSVNYIGTDMTIHQLYWYNSWLGGGPIFPGSPQNVRQDSDLGIDNGGGNIFYIATDNRIHKYSFIGSAWQESSLGGPGDVRAYSAIAVDAQMKVFYIGTDSRVHMYFLNGTTWTNQVLNAASGIAAAKSDLAVDTYGRVFYIGTDWKMHKMQQISGTWQDIALPSSVRSLSGASNSSLAVDPITNRAVYYVNTDGKIHQVIFETNGTYSEGAVQPNAPANVRNTAYDYQNMLASDANGNVYFVATDGRIHRYFWNNSASAWVETANDYNDPTNVWGGISTDKTGSYLYFVANDSKLWGSYWDCNKYFRVADDKTTAIDDGSVTDGDILVYPNPASENISIRISEDSPTEKMNIYDVQGSLKYSLSTTKKEVVVDVSMLPTGIYILQVISKEKVISKRITIDR